nr:energy transducer TonB [uncultured Flavobacterium sp.]
MQLFRFTEEEKKSAFITVIISVILVSILLFIRFTSTTSIDLLSDGGGGGGGVTVNFGDSEFGSGSDFNSEILQVTENQKAKPILEESINETLIAQENSTNTDYVVAKKDEIKKKEIKKEEPKKNVSVKQEVKKQTVSNETNNALANLLGGNKGGDGTDSQTGNKGNLSGSLNSSNYYGSGSGNGTGTGNGSGSGYGSGVGSGSGYSLGNRRAISKPLPAYKCNETGKVVVEVIVDKTGKTTNATAGVRGTTNNAKCLLDQAKIAAMNTKWEPSISAPDKQIGTIIYHFSIQ